MGLATVADAGTTTVGGSIPFQATNWNNTLTIPKFDPALGDLISVKFTLQAQNRGTAAYESRDAAPAHIVMIFASRIEVRRPDNSLILQAQPSVTREEDSAPFDGVGDFDGASGSTFANLQGSASTMATTPPPASDLALFTGPGTITLNVVATATSSGSGAGNLDLSFTSEAAATITVVYDFAEDCNDNNIPDDQDIDTGTSEDCDGNGVPDECEPDCDADGTIDACEPDCDHDGVPDDCEPDCDRDGTPDDCEPDCDNDGLPDDCDKDPCPDCVMLNRRNPGSLLLYPKFDNRRGGVTVLTVTNTNCDIDTGAIAVEIVYIGRFGYQGQPLNCLETNRTHLLSPCDTLTLVTKFDNPNHEQGYAYAFAKNILTGKAVVFNHLIGQELLFSVTNTLDDALNAVVFRGIGQEGSITDLDNDGNRDLDAREYDEAPEELLIPRFLAADDVGGRGIYKSELILIGLSGGTAFTTTIDFLIYNDNEQLFSAQYDFYCWEQPKLTDISSVFLNSFLQSTDDNLFEIIGAPQRESGWMRINGNVARSAAAEIDDPAIYAVLVERTTVFAVADLPYEMCTQNNGSLLPNGLFGDPD